MSETCEGLFNVAGHADVDCSGVVIPLKSEAGVMLSVPVAGDGVEGFEGSEEMFGMLASDILDAKIVHAEGEADRASVV
jgi:hypothetical protein